MVLSLGQIVFIKNQIFKNVIRDDVFKCKPYLLCTQEVVKIAKSLNLCQKCSLHTILPTL